MTATKLTPVRLQLLRAVSEGQVRLAAWGFDHRWFANGQPLDAKPAQRWLVAQGLIRHVGPEVHITEAGRAALGDWLTDHEQKSDRGRP